MKNLIFCIILIPFFSYAGITEKTDKEKSAKIFKRANWHLKQSDFLRAIPYLKECVNLDPEKAVYSYHLGKSLFEATQYKKSLQPLIRAYNLDPSVGKDIDYYLGRSMHMSRYFEEAIDFYQAALSKLDSDDQRYEIAEAGIMQCRNAPAIIDLKQDVTVKNLGSFVNTRFPEYAATFNTEASYMIYTTRRPRHIKQFAWGLFLWQDINEEVYEASLVDTLWMKSRLFTRPIPRYRHDASITLSEDGNTLIYYLDKNNGDIFISKKNEGKWSKRVSIGENINTRKHSEPSLWISADKTTLFFVSDKPGGKGKKDLYVSKLDQNGIWGPGENMGSGINTSLDEDAPFLSKDGKSLFFSSRGHQSMGGYDIFKSTLLPNGNWSKPVNLGVPTNSVGDDIYYVEEASGESFYFSSDRPGGFGEKDIYQGFSGSINRSCGPLPIAGMVFDKSNQKPMEAEVLLLNSGKDKVISTTKTSSDGKFAIVLPAGMEKYNLEVLVSPEAVSGGTAMPTGRINVLSGRVIDDITQEPLGGSVELVDPETGIVIDEVYTNPKTGNYYVPVASGKQYLLRAKSQRYNTSVEEFSVTAKGRIEAHKSEIGLQPDSEAGNKIVLNWQFFDVDQFRLKEFYSEDLINLVSVLEKIPELRLHIIGHTDGDGTVEYNQKLSTKRAISVLDYLVSKGIAKERLTSAGKGELEPLYSNEDKRLKKWNRRVELFLVN